MTPRSRKPVMLLGANGACPEANQTNIYKHISSLNEEDEDILLTPRNLLTFKIRRSKSDGDISDSSTACGDMSHVMSKSSNSLLSTESLTNIFKEYLIQRNVHTSYPLDSSFASQPEDFGSSNDFEYITEADMNESLLYCLDGNQPDDSSHDDDDSKVIDLMIKSKSKRMRDKTINNESDYETDIDNLNLKKVAMDYFGTNL